MLQVGGSQPKLVYASSAETRLLLIEEGEADLYQWWSDLNPNYPLVGTSIIFIVVLCSFASNLE